MADESVVVIKSRPVKAGNSLEDKTGMINGLCPLRQICVKSHISCEGMKFIRMFLELVKFAKLNTISQTWLGTIPTENCDRGSADIGCSPEVI